MVFLLSCSLAVLFAAGQVAGHRYTLKKTYDAHNFFHEFRFTRFGTRTSWLYDDLPQVLNHTKRSSVTKNMIGIRNNSVYLGVDYKKSLDSRLGDGGVTFQLQSKASFKHGLLIARFSHLPQQVCGGWSGFGTVGTEKQPLPGGINKYKDWRIQTANNLAMQLDYPEILAACVIDPAAKNTRIWTGKRNESKSANHKRRQSEILSDGIRGSPQDGIRAFEWTEDFIKIYSWSIDLAPSDISNNILDTSSWGTPSLQLHREDCNTNFNFSEQKMFLSLAICNNPMRTDKSCFFVPTHDVWGSACRSLTGKSSCVDYVTSKPGAFDEFYFEIQYIRYFNKVPEGQLSLDHKSDTLTFQYVASPSSDDNWVGIWHYSDKLAPRSSSIIFANAAQQSGAVWFETSTLPQSGVYKAYLVTRAGEILAEVPRFSFEQHDYDPTFHLLTRQGTQCNSSINNDITIWKSNGTCINTNCNVGSVDIQKIGHCPNEHVRISYWQQRNCRGDNYGFEYVRKGTCRSMWSGGQGFRSLWLSCGRYSTECAARGKCWSYPQLSRPVCRKAFDAALHNDLHCTGKVYKQIQVNHGDGRCVNTNCAVGSIDTTGVGNCSNGEVRISYWEKPGCNGRWFGYSYISTNTCHALWSNGYLFQSLKLSCSNQSDDCLSHKLCIKNNPDLLHSCWR